MAEDSNSLFPWKVQQLLSAVSNVVALPPQPDSSDSANFKTRQNQRSTATIAEEKPSQEVTEPDLVSETKQSSTVVEVPKGVIEHQKSSLTDADWELLSERNSHSSVGGGGIFVPRAGSVRSITSIDRENSSHTTLSVPFKIQRTASSSTIDSQDNILGPSGKGVLGVDYVEHIVLSTDTLQGVCLAYKVSASALRRANHFSSNSLHAAPKKLLIPLSKQALRTGFIRVQDTDSKEYKLGYFQAEYPDVSPTEAKAYLELADWELKLALQSAKEDREWETDEGDTKNLKSGQIGIHVNFRGGRPHLNLKGIGGNTPPRKNRPNDTADITDSSPSPEIPTKKKQVVVHSVLPAIATKSVLAEDLFKAAPEHSSFGLELKPLSKKEKP